MNTVARIRASVTGSVLEMISDTGLPCWISDDPRSPVASERM